MPAKVKNRRSLLRRLNLGVAKGNIRLRDWLGYCVLYIKIAMERSPLLL
jgi:hypothetical protein